MYEYKVRDKVRIKGKDSIRYPNLWVSPDMDHTIGKIGTIINDGFIRTNMPDKSYYVQFGDDYRTWEYGKTEIEAISQNVISNVIEVDSFIKV